MKNGRLRQGYYGRMGGGCAAGAFNQQSSLSSSLQTVIIWSSGTTAMQRSGAHPLNRLTKRLIRAPFPPAAVAIANPTQGYTFRRVTTEKKEDFPDGKRIIINSKKRKRR